MADYSQLISALNLSINQRITVKNAVDSIDPVDVGSSITDLSNALLPILNTINAFDILQGAIPPTNAQGVDDDMYFEYGTGLNVYKKISGGWVKKVAATFGINIVDGNINVQTSVNGNVVTASAGQWGINNVIYQTATQTQYTVPTADLNLDRIDAIFGKDDNTLQYTVGTASSNPDNTKPVTPANQVLISYIYVPNSSSGALPYIADSNVPIITIQSVTSGSATPTGGGDGDIYFQTTTNGFAVWQKTSGSWASVFTYTAPSGVSNVIKSEADLLDAGGGDWYLPYSLSGSTQQPIAIYVNYGGTTLKSLPVNYSVNGLYGFQDPALGSQTILVKLA